MYLVDDDWVQVRLDFLGCRMVQVGNFVQEDVGPVWVLQASVIFFNVCDVPIESNENKSSLLYDIVLINHSILLLEHIMFLNNTYMPPYCS